MQTIKNIIKKLNPQDFTLFPREIVNMPDRMYDRKERKVFLKKRFNKERYEQKKTDIILNMHLFVFIIFAGGIILLALSHK